MENILQFVLAIHKRGIRCHLTMSLLVINIKYEAILNIMPEDGSNVQTNSMIIK